MTQDALNLDIVYPIAEIFIAPQGEGKLVGTLMAFVRLAGCTVGTRYPSERYESHLATETSPGQTQLLKMLPNYTNECHIYDGRTMACDTDYRKKQSMTPAAIIDAIRALGNVNYICISGGEPLMHRLDALTLMLTLAGYKCVLETSGTILLTMGIKELFSTNFAHIAVSPKLGFLDAYTEWADEFKLLVDENFSWDTVPASIRESEVQIYLQPINNENTVNEANIKRCLALQLEHPDVTISLQAHKLWGTR